MKKIKKKKKLTKKQIIILIIITIVLGILCYFISTEITKSIIDHITMEEKKKNEDYSDLLKPETIDNISLQDFINNYNENATESISIESIDNNRVIIDNIEIEFYLNNNNINIISINFDKKNKKVKEIISNIIIANNKEITDESIELIYNKVFETLGYTKDKRSETSEFYQYKGLEFSLKKHKNNDYKYSFRIGRIVKDETEKSDES